MMVKQGENPVRLSDASSRIILRTVQATDLARFHAQAYDEDALRMAPPARAPETWESFRARWLQVLSNDEVACRTVLLDERVAGYLARFPQEGTLSVAYWYGRSFWGQGLAREALGQFLASLDTRPLQARTAAINTASQRVLTANGFEPVGTGSYYSPYLDRDVDEIVFRLASGTSRKELVAPSPALPS